VVLQLPVVDGGDGSVRATRDTPYEHPAQRVTLDL